MIALEGACHTLRPWSVSCPERFDLLGHVVEALLHQLVYAALREGAVLAANACLDAGQYLDALIDGSHRVDVELALADGVQHLALQHEVAHVALRDEAALLPGQTVALAHLEVTFDLLIDTADGLHLAALVDGA